MSYNNSTHKRSTEQVVVIPDRTMVCNDVQRCTSVAGAGSTGATDGQGCTSVAGAGSAGAADVGRLYQLTENGVLKAEYIYNDMGQRTKKTLYQVDGITVDSTTIYHYDQWGMLITETNEQGNLIKDYIWNEMYPVAQIDAVIPAKPVPKQACPRESGGGDRNPVNRSHYILIYRPPDDQ